jgi:hypothetical protein
MLFAAVSVGVMIYALVTYGLRDDPPPKSTDLQPLAGEDHVPAGLPAHAGGTLSPIQVFANAKVGDWQAYSVTTESSLGPTFHATGIVTITELDDREVKRGFVGRIAETGERREQQYEGRPRAGLTIDQLTTNDVGGWTIHDLVITDDVHEIGGRSFKCKKISYASEDPLFPNKRTRTELWISDEVAAGGLVEEREVQDMPSAHFVITQRLLGFGNASGTTWGTKPDGL